MQWKHTDWNIKEVFEENRIPKVDVVRNVMEKIHFESNKKVGFFMKYRVSIIVCLGLMLMGTTGFAAIKVYELHNEEGKVIYQEKNITESSTPVKTPDKEMQAFTSKMTEIDESLQPGTAAAVYIKENNPKKRVVTLSKPFIYKELHSLQQKLGNHLIVKNVLPGGYLFDGAIVDYFVKQEYNKDELYALAEKTNEEYVLKPLSFTNSISTVEISYRKENDSVLVKMEPFDDVENNTVYQANMDQKKTEKITIKQTEALFSEQANQDGIEKEIRWVQNINGVPFLFTVQTRAENTSKDSLIQVMESLL
ncbi:hypothetical protein ACI7RC_25465 [Brevibacillus sp. B_LB10_24]|uniref:hypothetical protein n=1 Tax=Brevibacillus sp. B_LB10_24 TaxID=3380645 RepID=UPI0038BDD642